MEMTLKLCKKCKIFEGKNPIPPLINITSANQPMDLVHVDFIGREITVSRKRAPVIQKVLVVVNHFSLYIQVYKIEDKLAVSMTKCLYDNYFWHITFPQCIMSDQGTEFCNCIIELLCVYLGIKKIQTTPYHPQSNGAMEHLHQTIQQMLGKLEGKKWKHLPKHFGSVALAYDVTSSQVTRFSHYFLMFRRCPRLPVDLQFPTVREILEHKGIHDYMNM